MQTRLLAIFAALFAAIALIAGCSSKSQDSSKPLPDAATLLKEVQRDHQVPAERAPASSTVQGEIKELPIESLEGDLTNTPAVAAQGNANIIFLGQRLEGVDFVGCRRNLYGALTEGSYQDLGPAADIYDVSAILNPDTGLANVLANFTDPKADGRETIDGVDTVRRSPGRSAPTPSTRSRRRSPRPGRSPAPRGSARTATTNWSRPSWSRRPATASR